MSDEMVIFGRWARCNARQSKICFALLSTYSYLCIIIKTLIHEEIYCSFTDPIVGVVGLWYVEDG